MIRVLSAVEHPTVIRIRDQGRGLGLPRVGVGNAMTGCDIGIGIRTIEPHFRAVEQAIAVAVLVDDVFEAVAVDVVAWVGFESVNHAIVV